MRRWTALLTLLLTGCAAYAATPARNTNSGARYVRSVPIGVVSLLEAKPIHLRRARSVRRASIVKAKLPAAPVPAPRRSPPSTPPRPPAPPENDGYHGSVAALIRSAFGSAAPTALCIAWRESRFDPYARNPHSSASGIFQLTRIWWDGVFHFNPFNAWANIHYASVVYERYGWGPWEGGC